MIGPSALGRAWYRARQFGNVFRSRLSAAADLLRQTLKPAQQRLFAAMPPVAQRHHLDVCLDLQRQGWDDPEVLAAALLHDVGKGALGAWERAVIVVIQNLAPALIASVSRYRGPGRGPLAWLSVQAGPAERGAALVAAAGGAQRTVEIIRYHECGGDDPALDPLRQADNNR